MMKARNDEGQRRSDLPPPRFDAHAHLKAQRVRPIPKGVLTLFFEKVFANSSKSIALIVILGFLTGALIGVSLVGQNTSAPTATDQVSREEQPSQLHDAEVGVSAVQTEPANFGSAAIRRPRVPNNGQPRAYRFAVIR